MRCTTYGQAGRVHEYWWSCCATYARNASASSVCDAELDQLTGLATRRALEERIDAALSRSGNLGSSATLLLVDLDHFKHINDAAGHPAGDEMLRLAAARSAFQARPDPRPAAITAP